MSMWFRLCKIADFSPGVIATSRTVPDVEGPSIFHLLIKEGLVLVKI